MFAIDKGPHLPRPAHKTLTWPGRVRVRVYRSIDLATRRPHRRRWALEVFLWNRGYPRTYLWRL